RFTHRFLSVDELRHRRSGCTRRCRLWREKTEVVVPTAWQYGPPRFHLLSFSEVPVSRPRSYARRGHRNALGDTRLYRDYVTISSMSTRPELPLRSEVRQRGIGP